MPAPEPDSTEAACLLQTGATYSRRIGLRPAGGGLTFVGLKRGGFSIYVGDAPIYHFDLDGRWQRAFLDGVHYLKGPDGSAVAIDRVREGANLVLKRRTLAFAEAGDLDAAIRGAAIDLVDAADRDPAMPPAGIAPLDPATLRELLERVAGWDAAAWFARREAYLATYGPLPFLPPEAPNAVILQATLGHAGGLAFGGADPAEPYVRTPAEFADHARAVARLLGRRVLQCRGVFLGGPDLLCRPLDDVAAYLEATASSFPLDPDARRRPRDLPADAPSLDGIAAFLDRFGPGLPVADGYRRLRALGLIRVTLGIESGAPEVRARYGKTWDDAEVRAAVADLTAAGIAVNLVLLVGAGGLEDSEHHVPATADLIASLDLAPGSLIYLVDAAEVGGPPAADLLRRQGRTPLAPAETADQFARFKVALAPAWARFGVKVIPYSLEKQLG